MVSGGIRSPSADHLGRSVTADRPRIAEVTEELFARAPEDDIEPSLQRIALLLDLMGQPQHSAPVITVAGTNGKSSTARMIDTLVRALGLRCGLTTSLFISVTFYVLRFESLPFGPHFLDSVSFLIIHRNKCLSTLLACTVSCDFAFSRSLT